MKREGTIRKTIAQIKRLTSTLDTDDRAFDQSYGAVEALRWVLGEGPNPRGLAEPLEIVRPAANDHKEQREVQQSMMSRLSRCW